MPGARTAPARTVADETPTYVLRHDASASSASAALSFRLASRSAATVEKSLTCVRANSVSSRVRSSSDESVAFSVTDGCEIICPRCGSTSVNFHPGHTTRLLTCRWCVFEHWVRMIEHEIERTLAEADRITRDAA